jgi:PIN domain nuclease of toxin-antitoxin system
MLGGVTDTHALVWFATNQLNKLGQAARRIFAAADQKDGSGIVSVPTAVLHEISCLLVANFLIGYLILIDMDISQ